MKSSTKTALSFCRICTGQCGMIVSVDEKDRIVGIAPDREDTQTLGYACPKGLQAVEAHNGPQRMLRPLKRMPDGEFSQIGLEQALDEIARKLEMILENHGPEAVAGYRGSGGFYNSSALAVLNDWLESIGSPKVFSSFTIDQSAKYVASGRMGVWPPGKPPIGRGEVLLVAGSNPLVSVAATGGDPRNPAKRYRKLKSNGTKMIVIDPRRTETAELADLFLQPLPGHDAEIFAALLRIVLHNGWHDQAFCDHYVGDLERLRTALTPFTCNIVAERAGITPEQLVEVADLFARQCRTGAAFSGTGPDMGPHSNLAEHLIETLNVVCGRLLREGDVVDNPGVITGSYPRKAAVVPAPRWWDHGYKSRVGDYGLFMGELPAGILADEILEPGPGQVRALINHGGNPASAIPGQSRIVEALRSLELLVSIEPYMTTTASLSDYILPPKLQYERADLPMYTFETVLYPGEPFTRYTPAVVRPPDGSEVADDAYFFWALAKRLGIALRYRGTELDMTEMPSVDQLLAISCQNSIVPFDEIKAHPRGLTIECARQVVQPAEPSDTGRFTLLPGDVQEELRALETDLIARGAEYPFRLAVRRLRHVNNSTFRDIPALRSRVPTNFAYMNPGDLAEAGLTEGARVSIASRFGSVEARVSSDATLRQGVISMAHGFGWLPGKTDPDRDGSSANALLAGVECREAINAMPQMTGLPVRLELASILTLAASD